ncbi:MAG: DUF4835 family protein [Rhodothermales bacterium]|nr:DUF4835 family protein [Rhodothermales bacterium]MBO6779707.1 DUF4835 family protein [Rhodothermales bacterium]
MRYLPAFLLLILLAVPAQAQELNCSVTINYANLSGSDYTYLDELRERVAEYMNDRRWTEDRYEETERIECTMQIVMMEAVSLTSFRARLIVATRRPIYGTAQQSTVVQFSDEDWRFDYPQGTPLVWEPDRFHPLTSVLNFYGYLILGYDYDTFSEYGGTAHFERARRIAEIAQSSGALGWQSLGGDRSKGELISQIMDQRYRDLRKAYFDYHYHGLDRFVATTERSRAAILQVIQDLSGLYTASNRIYFLDQFFATKYQELVAVFKGSPVASQAFDLLQQMDPAHLSDYTQMMQ